jgi:hypothetical protein
MSIGCPEPLTISDNVLTDVFASVVRSQHFCSMSSTHRSISLRSFPAKSAGAAASGTIIMSVNGSSASGTINGTYNRDSFKGNWPGSGNPGCYALGYLHPGYLVREILLHQGPFVFKTLAHHWRSVWRGQNTRPTLYGIASLDKSPPHVEQ